MNLWQKHDFTKMAINRKILQILPNVSGLQLKVPRSIIIYCHKCPYLKGSLTSNNKSIIFARTFKPNVAAKWRINDIQPKRSSDLDTLPGYTLIANVKI